MEAVSLLTFSLGTYQVEFGHLPDMWITIFYLELILSFSLSDNIIVQMSFVELKIKKRENWL